ncbi:tRNA (adenosine(37)-N6)-dimethylallyltransferase MiaA [Prevotella corporis]|uniref:tRNA (adenosine(37)-N6)-dimethylallyltransferase MiaA n=1 Tax=Prevotella corporis TaxID=28128 RepID=UPI0023651C3E|nr:tRNA (adenosine(37)-N6)-dimethylallyltransferase MiaA [Prevotella corporis]
MDKMITIIGPTASGKTSFAAALSARIGAEIISADSRQVYRRMDIGTGKDLDDYVVNGKKIPYHLIDIAEPGTQYNLFQYQQDFHTVYDKLQFENRPIVLCGGTGLYVEAVLNGYALSPVPQDPVLRKSLEGKSLSELEKILVELKTRNHSVMHNKTDVDTTNRAIRAIEIETYQLSHPVGERQMPKVNSLIIGLDINRDERRRKITQRLKDRLANGMVEEVKSLLDSGIPAENLIYYGLEYKFVTQYIIGELSFDEMFAALEIAIHQFAKRQMTWFRGMERRGFQIHWLNTSLPMDEKIKFAESLLGNDNIIN